MAKRLFIALELPLSCRERLAALAVPLRGIRWLAADQLHLTLAFLGDVGEAAEQRLCERLAALRVPPFFIHIEGVGYFGGVRPSILWAGVGPGHPHLFALHKRVHDGLLAAHFDLAQRPFHPHVTLARLTGVAAATLRPFLRRHECESFAFFEVTTFVLMSSRPGPRGSVYSVEARYNLMAQGRSSAGGGNLAV